MKAQGETTQRRGREILSVLQDDGGAAPPFVLVLAGYGDAFAAVELARGMGEAQSLIALQPPDSDAAFARVGTVQALAGLYVQELLRVRPHGPFFLGGYSAGALLALEMAQQLRASDHAVPLLLLFDPLLLHYTRLEKACYGAVKALVERTTTLGRRIRPHQILLAMMRDKGLDRHMTALAGYAPQPYAGRVVLVEAHWSGLLRPPTFIPGWRRIVPGGLERFRPGGNHHTFMRPPHVGRLGRQVREWMQTASLAP